MKTASKRYREALKVADLQKDYSLDDAIAILARFPKTRFDETVELSFRLAVDPKQSDQMVRGTVVLPHGSGRKVRVLVFTTKPEEALAAGADFAGLKDLIDKVKEGWMDFDVAVSTVEAMKEVRAVARVLGPRGLMPNPKSGTVTDDIPRAIKEVKAGRVEFKMDKTGNLALGIGRRSFTATALRENAQAVLEAIHRGRPAGIQGQLVLNVVLSSTMSPGVKLASAEYAKI